MTNNLNKASNTNNPNQDNLSLKIDRLYVKEISCKIPHAPGLYETNEFKENMGQMSSSVEINIKTQTIAKDQYEVVLHVIIHGKAKNLSLFVLEVQQAGIFTLRVPASNLEEVIKNYCVGFLHSYLSQVVTNTIVQAGFPSLILQPIVSSVEFNLDKIGVSKKDFLQETTKPIQEKVAEKDNFQCD